MHTFASKISKTDAYVTPAPDRRFCVDLSAVLAGDVGPDDDAIRTESVSQWPGSPVAKKKVWEGGVAKHQEVIVDDEIIQYERIGPEGEWNTFLWCLRGAQRRQTSLSSCWYPHWGARKMVTVQARPVW